MKNWYKQSQRIKDFQDRTEVNENIRSLKKIATILSYASLLVFQTGRGAKDVVRQIIDNKKMSSYEDLQDMLREAESLALDSPNKFGEICRHVAKMLLRKAKSLEIERKDFVNNLSRKGLTSKE